jgi:hypothetical protein
MSRVYCLAEDRAGEEVGLRIALASLRRACPGAAVVVHRPLPSAAFRNWLLGCPGVHLVPEMPAGASSWNCKPHVLLPLLEAGHAEAIWLDSDLLISRDPSKLFDGVDPAELIGTEEPASSVNQGSAIRAAGWGFPLGRAYPVTLNTCVLRVTAVHAPLLRRWKKLLEDPVYVAAQARPLWERPVYLMSDQDVLNALLGAQEFESLPVRFLRGGMDVIHCGGALGYSLRQRLNGIFRRVPPFLHAIASKPWAVFSAGYRARHSRWFNFYRGVLQETSPYVASVRKLRKEIGVDCPWLEEGTWLGGGLRALGFGHFALRGLPLTLAATAWATVARLTKGSRRHPGLTSPGS